MLNKELPHKFITYVEPNQQNWILCYYIALAQHTEDFGKLQIVTVQSWFENLSQSFSSSEQKPRPVQNWRKLVQWHILFESYITDSLF